MDDSKPQRTRRRLDERAWQAVLARFDGAAMTVQEFCRREGLTRSSFARWRLRLQSQPLRALAPAAPSPPSPMAKRVATQAALGPKPSFVDLGLLGATSSAPAAQHAGLDLRIELGGGISLHLVRR